MKKGVRGTLQSIIDQGREFRFSQKIADVPNGYEYRPQFFL